VLEVGAGAGRFTMELARLGARVTVVDISPEQLRLNEEHVAEGGLEDAVEARHLADVLDLSRFEDRSFDAVVCYGGPLSWALDGADRAFEELLRVTKAEGHVLLGVMSRFGSLHAFLPTAEEEIRAFGVEEMQEIVDSGYLPDNHSTLGPMHLFTWGSCGRCSSATRATSS
jgi:ubiquinone/menaquinone biosynthesis C-methylase UbiE